MPLSISSHRGRDAPKGVVHPNQKKAPKKRYWLKPKGVSKQAMTRWKSLRAGARKRSPFFALTPEDVQAMLNTPMCAGTGIVFDEHKADNPRIYGRSIDRIDSSRGYTTDNVQVVCNWYNMAKRSFTDDLMVKMCRAVLGFRGTYPI
jgi:hypothetical protein